MLILVRGLPGSGKTKIAEEISKRLNALLLSTDRIRKKIFKKPKYKESEKWLIYRIMFLLTDEFLKNKISVILDAVFSKQFSIIQAKKIAKKNKTAFKIIEVRCQEDILLKRIGERIKKGDLSDADKRIYFKIKKEFKPIKEKHVIINNSEGFKKTKEKIKKFLKVPGVI